MFAVKRLSKINFSDLATFLRGSKGNKKLWCVNTTVFWHGNEIHVQYYNTVILKFHPDESVKMFSGGWRHSSTKWRLKKLTGTNLYSYNGQWYVNEHPFFDGIKLGPDGVVTNAS